MLNVVKSGERIRDFLAADELEVDAYSVMTELEGEGVAVKVQDGLFKWTKEGEKEQMEEKKEEMEIDIPSLEVRTGELLVILGRVGSGKSSLLEALTGQMHRRRGLVTLAHRKVAYCPQTPFILAGSVQDNIVGFDLSLNTEMLEKVIDACALREDLKLLPGGLACEIGEKGINLSGGQRYESLDLTL